MARTSHHPLTLVGAAVGLALCLALSGLAASPARADSIDDVASMLNTIDANMPADSSELLPFHAADLIGYRDMIKACEGSSGTDDVIACVDAASSSQAGQQGGVPSWFPQMIDVYFDIKIPDYWGLFEDAGEAVACATGEALTGGVDVCGAIKELIDAAKDVAKAAEAVGQFLEDLGTALVDLGEDIVCWFSSCSNDTPKISDADKAWSYFYLPRIPAGLSIRMGDKLKWTNYSGEGQNFEPQVVDEGLAAAGGFTKAGLMQSLPKFIAAVNAQWDAKMFPLAADIQKASYGWNADWAKHYLDQIQASLSGYGDDLSFYKWRSGVVSGKAMAHDDCVGAMAGLGGQQVDDWVAAGGPQHPGMPPGFKWPDNYPALCKVFDAQLDNQFRPFVIQRYYQHVSKHCSADGDSAHNAIYTCPSKYTVDECHELMQMWDGSPQQCKWTGAGKAPYQCKDGYKLLSLPEPPAGYPGCKRIYQLPGQTDPSQ